VGNVNEKISCKEGRNRRAESRKVLIFKSKKQICRDLQKKKKWRILNLTLQGNILHFLEKNIQGNIARSVIKINIKADKNDLCASSY
jgi:hypothetical protein